MFFSKYETSVISYIQIHIFWPSLGFLWLLFAFGDDFITNNMTDIINYIIIYNVIKQLIEFKFTFKKDNLNYLT